MLRDQAEETMDMEVLDEAVIEDLNMVSIRGYRNSHKAFKPGHPFERLDDNEYFRVIGAAGVSKEDKKLHPTAAGMLMFGNEYDIVQYFPDYFLDYRENPDTVIRWTDRLQSSSGEWSGNLFDFYFRIYNKTIKDIKVPFKFQDGFRLSLSFVKKVAKKTQEKYKAILNAMQPNVRHKASEFEGIVGVKESRMKVLLKDMTEQGLIESVGSTKGKMYRKIQG